MWSTSGNDFEMEYIDVEDSNGNIWSISSDSFQSKYDYSAMSFYTLNSPYFSKRGMFIFLGSKKHPRWAIAFLITMEEYVPGKNTFCSVNNVVFYYI